jgi:hypothetical protein
MMPSDALLKRIADGLATELIRRDLLDLRGSPAALRERFFTVLRDNFAREAAIEREAEAFADSHRREMLGMDRHKVVDLVKQRLAKEKDFPL